MAMSTPIVKKPSSRPLNQPRFLHPLVSLRSRKKLQLWWSELFKRHLRALRRRLICLDMSRTAPAPNNNTAFAY
jgi:hypothetical protein